MTLGSEILMFTKTLVFLVFFNDFAGQRGHFCGLGVFSGLFLEQVWLKMEQNEAKMATRWPKLEPKGAR